MVKQKFDTNSAREFFASYGYEVRDPTFKYTNMRAKIPLYDTYNEKNVNLSLSQVDRQAFKAATKRPKYINNIMDVGFQPPAQTPQRSQEELDSRRVAYKMLNAIDFQPSSHVQKSQEERLFEKLPEALQYAEYYVSRDKRERVKA